MAGEGSIYKRRDSNGRVVGWVAQLSLGGRQTRAYERRWRATRDEAVAALEEMKADRRAGVKRSRMMTGDYLASWIRDVRNIKPSTRHGYEVAIGYHLIPTLGDIRLSDLTPRDVERALAKLERRMSPKMLANVFGVLRRALNMAKRAGLVTRNVASSDYVDAPTVPDQEPESFAPDEVARLLTAAHGDWIAAALQVSIGTGLRQGELLGLAWEDIDWQRRVLHIRRELVRRDGRYQRVELKNGSRSRRDLPLSPAVGAALRQHEAQLRAAGLVPIASGPVFVTPAGAPLSGSWMTHRLYKLEAIAGVRRLPWKNLRTTFASRLFASGVSDRQLADWMGHTRTKTTHGHYIDTADASYTRALAAIDELVSRSVGLFDGPESLSHGLSHATADIVAPSSPKRVRERVN